MFWCNTRWGIAPLKPPAAMSPAARPIPAHFDWAKGSGKARVQDIDSDGMRFELAGDEWEPV